MTNPKRGEVEIQLGSRTLTGKVTLDSIIRIETTLGMGLVEATRKLSDGSMTTLQVIQVLLPIIRGGGNDITEKDVRGYVWDAGLADSMREVGKVLINALSAGRDEGNEEEAEAGV